jgi:hypothetical protein
MRTPCDAPYLANGASDPGSTTRTGFDAHDIVRCVHCSEWNSAVSTVQSALTSRYEDGFCDGRESVPSAIPLAIFSGISGVLVTWLLGMFL